MPTPAENHVQQLESASRIEAYGRQFIFGIATIYPKTNRYRLVFFRPFPPVLARVLVSLRRTLPTRTPRFRAVFCSQIPPILCSCEGRRRARTSNDESFRLIVHYEKQCSLATRIKQCATTLSCPGVRVNGCTEHGLNSSYSLTSQ